MAIRCVRNGGGPSILREQRAPSRERRVTCGSSEAEAELLQLERQMFAAIRARDRQALAQLLAEEFEFHAPGSAPVRKAAFIETVTAIPGSILSVESADVQARAFGTMGVLTGHQTARVRVESGAIETDTQAFVDIAQKRGGRWQLVLAYSDPRP